MIALSCVQAMAAMEAQTKAEKKAKKEIEASGGNEYIGAIRENTNKSDEVDASGVDSAIAALDISARFPLGRSHLRLARVSHALTHMQAPAPCKAHVRPMPASQVRQEAARQRVG